MHNVVSRSLGTALLAVVLTAAGALPAVADAPRRPSQADAVSPGGYTAVDPVRVLDTRKTTPVAAGTAVRVPVRGPGLPFGDGAATAVLNVTAVDARTAGYLTAYPTPNPGTDPGRPGVSTLNFLTGQTVANLAVVPIGSDGSVQVYNGSTGTVQILVDATGSFTAGDRLNPATADGSFTATGPRRVLDTRNAVPIPARGTYRLPLGNLVTALAGAAVLNVTAVTPPTAGFLTLYPGGTRPPSSSVNYAAGVTVATLSAVRLAADQSVTIYNSSAQPVQVVVDLSGSFKRTTARVSGMFSFLTPARILDTRAGIGSPQAQLAAGATRTVTVDGRGGVPTSDVSAVLLTVTVTDTSAPGYVAAYPTGTSPTASTLNFLAGQTVSNLAVVPVRSGTVTIVNGSSRPVSVVADVAGYVRDSDLVVPFPGDSRYIRSLSATQTDAQITSTTRAYGVDDGDHASATDPQVSLLQFGAQTNRAGGDGSGSGTQLGILQSTTNERLTYPQVVAAMKGYLDGYVAAAGPAPANPTTIAVGTSTAGFEGATYTPAAKGKDWADQVIEPLVAYARTAAPGIKVVAGNDIEANFDAQISEVKTWISSYLGAGPNSLINNGAAVQCPTVLGQTGTTCGPVAVEESSSVHTWTQADYVAVSAGLGRGRISVLPQIYSTDAAVQWENIAVTAAAAGTPLTFAGVLTSVNACFPANSGCSSIGSDDAWTAMTQALESNTATSSLVVPAVTDLIVS